MRVFCVFHDPAVLYSFLSLFLLNKADFSHYSIRCQQLPLPGCCQKPAGAFPGLGSGYCNPSGHYLRNREWLSVSPAESIVAAIATVPEDNPSIVATQRVNAFFFIAFLPFCKTFYYIFFLKYVFS